MLEPPRRSALSVDRARTVFKRFARTRFSVLKIGGPGSLALVAALLAGFQSMVIQGLRREPNLFPLPPLELAPALWLLLVLALGNAMISPMWTGSRRDFRGRILSLLILVLRSPPSAGKSETNAPGRAGHEVLRFVALDRPRLSRWRKSRLVRNFEVGSLPLLIQFFLIYLIFLGVSISLARQPAGSSEQNLAYGIQLYLWVIGIFACYRAEKLEKNGNLTPGRRWPFWPLAALPWGASVLVPLYLLYRGERLWSGELNSTALFSNRRVVTRENWISRSKLLPRLRESKLMSSGSWLEIESFLRCRTMLLVLQAIFLGILWPLVFRTAPAEAISNFGAIAVFLLGFVLRIRKPPSNSPSLSARALVAAWLLIATGGSSFGWIVGSSIGNWAVTNANAHLLLGSLAAGLGMALIFITGTTWGCSLRSSDLIWLPAILGAGLIGWIGMKKAAIGLEVVDALVVLTAAAWLADIALGFSYRRLFLDPFTIREIWNRRWPSTVRLRLLALTAILFLPLGGLANAYLAVISLRRDRMLRWWWETRGERT